MKETIVWMRVLLLEMSLITWMNVYILEELKIYYLQPILELPINQLDNLVADYTFVQDILEEFQTLKQAQLEIFAEDTQHFIEQQQQRDTRYNALMYKMRKQLMKQ